MFVTVLQADDVGTHQANVPLVPRPNDLLVENSLADQCVLVHVSPIVTEVEAVLE